MHAGLLVLVMVVVVHALHSVPAAVHRMVVVVAANVMMVAVAVGDTVMVMAVVLCGPKLFLSQGTMKSWAGNHVTLGELRVRVGKFSLMQSPKSHLFYTLTESLTKQEVRVCIPMFPNGPLRLSGPNDPDPCLSDRHNSFPPSFFFHCL